MRTRIHIYQISKLLLINLIIHAIPVSSNENEKANTDKNNATKNSEVHKHMKQQTEFNISLTSKNNTNDMPVDTKVEDSTSKPDKNISLETKNNTNITSDTTKNGKHVIQHHFLEQLGAHTSLPNKSHIETPSSASGVHQHEDGAKETSNNYLNKTDDTVDNKKNNISSKIQIHNATKNSNTSASNVLQHLLDETAGHIQRATAYSNCTPPAIRQFPRPLMSPSVRLHGGLIIHVIVAVYMFLGLAIVCDEYFVAALDRICEELKMSPHVAGATFMAAGSSAPELATVIIGVFLAQDDIGISGVIGSAVFNIMFVIACCGLCTSAVIYLNWWPLLRDCFFYAVSILVLLGVMYDKRITWVESVVMLFTYFLYCVVLYFNTPLEKYAQTLPVPFKHTAPTEESGLVSYKTLDDDGKLPNYGMDWSPEKQPENTDEGFKNFGMEWSPEKHQQAFTNQLSGPALNQATTVASPPPQDVPKSVMQDYYKPKEFDPSTQVNPLIKPEGGFFARASWAIVYPIHFFCRLTMPDCRSEKYKNWYTFTFFISMLWISFYSYFMVWMITIIGYTLRIPDTVMGLTFVAAGVSVPDALSSVAVIKEGYGDMAVSNAVGSNVFDILICLGLPWFIKTAIVSPGSTVKVISKGLTYSTLSLLSTVVFLVVATHMNGWKLDRRYGVVLMIWYLIFITFASLYELNVFGKFNPMECEINW